MEEWKEYKLGEITNMKNGKKRPQSNGVFPIYGGNGIMDYSDSYNAENAIIVGRVGAYCGCVYKCDGKCWVSDNAISVFAKDIVDTQFLYYLMTTLDFHHHHIGGAQPLMTQDIIGDFSVSIPPLSVQNQIVHILKSCDNKIEVNRRINDNLEKQALALFKSWFVDFDPFRDGKFVESEMGMIPKGWRVIQLGDILDISKASITPSKNPDSIFSHYSIPAYDNDMKPDSQWGKEILSNKFVVENKMTLFSKLNPRIKRIWFVDDIEANSICSTEFVPYIAKDKLYFAYVHSIISSQPFYNYVMSMVNGATGSHQRFHPEETLSYLIPFNKDIALQFNNIIKPLLSMILKNRDESHRLAELRDILLPKLMSGEIHISDRDLINDMLEKGIR